jgi:hypothetical protein
MTIGESIRLLVRFLRHRDCELTEAKDPCRELPRSGAMHGAGTGAREQGNGLASPARRERRCDDAESFLNESRFVEQVVFCSFL